jgi:hypothetical protein
MSGRGPVEVDAARQKGVQIVVEAATMHVRRREIGVWIEPAVWAAVRVLDRRGRRREPGQGRLRMPLLEHRRRRRRQARRRRDASLGAKDARAVRRAVRCSRRSRFLHLCCRLPPAPVLVHDGPPCNICRPFSVRHPLGPLFPRSRLLHRRREASSNVVVPGEDEFPGQHLGGVEQRRRCVWRLDLVEWREKWLGHGWILRLGKTQPSGLTHFSHVVCDDANMAQIWAWFTSPWTDRHVRASYSPTRDRPPVAPMPNAPKSFLSPDRSLAATSPPLPPPAAAPPTHRLLWPAAGVLCSHFPIASHRRSPHSGPPASAPTRWYAICVASFHVIPWPPKALYV